MNTMIHNLSKAKKSVIAALLCVSMVIGLLLVVPPVSAQAVEINAGDQGFTLYGSGTGTTSGFENGAQISVTNTSRTANNKKTAVYTYDGSAWSKAGDDYVVWQGTGDNTFEAYTPVVTGASYTGFTLPADQKDGVSAADWMTATYTGKKGSAYTIDLGFTHRLTKVTVTVTGWGDEYKGTETLTEPTFVSLHGKVTANGTALTGDNTATNVSAAWKTEEVDGKNVTSATAILVPGTYNSDPEEFFTFKVDGSELSVNAPANLELKAGTHYTFNLTVGKEAVLVSSVSVTDWLDGADLTGGDAERVLTTIVYDTETNTATINVAENATADEISKLVSEAVESSVSTIVIKGNLAAELQSELVTALDGNTTPKIVFEDMNIADLSDDVKWMGNPIDTADGAILEVASCGVNAQYMIYHTGDASSRTLSIKGTGAMANYDGNSYAPWFDQESYQIPDNITKVEIAEGISTIGDNTFGDGYGIASVTLPDGITSIGWRGFASCLSLTSITIPKDVTSISSYAFGACRSLESVTVLATAPPTLGTNVFNNCSENLIIYVPAESVQEYKSKWSAYADIIQPISNNRMN